MITIVIAFQKIKYCSVMFNPNDTFNSLPLYQLRIRQALNKAIHLVKVSLLN